MGIDNLGKEELLLYLAVELDTRVLFIRYVFLIIDCGNRRENEGYSEYRLHSFIFLHYRSNTRLYQSCPQKSGNRKKVHFLTFFILFLSVQYWNRMRPTIGVVASGWSSSLWKQGKLYPTNVDKPLVYVKISFSMRY
jgi:hypothetical protein